MTSSWCARRPTACGCSAASWSTDRPTRRSVWTLQSRTLLESPDMRNERRILETQELMRQRNTPPPEPVADWPPINPNDPFDLFEVGMRALGESPLAEHDKAVLEDFAPLRLRPGRKFDLRAFSESRARGDQARHRPRPRRDPHSPASASARPSTAGAIRQRNLGNFGDDYLYRAVIALTALARARGRGGDLPDVRQRRRGPAARRQPALRAALPGRPVAAGAGPSGRSPCTS